MDCSICCEKFNKSNLKPVTCGFCVNFTACLACVKRYLLETTQTAHCMNCKHEWSRVNLIDNIPKTFIEKEYKKRRQELILELEKSMMPATQPYVEIEIERNRIQELYKEVQELRSKKYRVNSYSDRYLEYELDCVRKEHYIKCIIKEIQVFNIIFTIAQSTIKITLFKPLFNINSRNRMLNNLFVKITI